MDRLEDRAAITEQMFTYARATDWLAHAPAAEVREVLSRSSAELGSPEYLELLRSPALGLVEQPVVSVHDLRVLTSIRRASGVYAPDDDVLAGLVAS